MNNDQSDPRTVTMEPLRAAVVRGEGVQMARIRDFFDSGFQTLGRVLGEQGVEPSGPAIAHYLHHPAETVDLEIGFRVGDEFHAADEVTLVEIPGGTTAQLVHTGPYEGLGQAWERLASWTVAQQVRPLEWFLEEYLTEPTPGADPAAMQTRLTLPFAAQG